MVEKGTVLALVELKVPATLKEVTTSLSEGAIRPRITATAQRIGEEIPPG